MNTTCCDEGEGQFAVLGHARIPESVVSSIRATGTSTASSAPHTNSSMSSIAPTTASQIIASTSASTPASASSTPLPASIAGLSQSAKIGIGVGISFGTLLVALLSFIAFHLYRRSRSSPANFGKAEEIAPEPKDLKGKIVNIELQQTHELTGAETPKEMYTIHNTHEVEAETGARELWNSRFDK